MSVLTAVLTDASPSVCKRLNKLKRIVLRHISMLILKKRRRKIHDEASHQAYQAACKAIRTAVQQNISCQELDLIDHPHLAAFYKYINKKIGRQHQYHHLSDNARKAVTDNTIAANLFYEEFGKNFSPSVPFNTSTNTDGYLM